MIVFDTETTGLTKPGIVPLDQQPYMIEFAGIKVDKDLNEVETLHFLVKPPIPLPEVITKITGLTDEKLKDALPFAAHYPVLVKFFLGQGAMAAHNCSFDRDILKYALMRIDKLINFPWPATHICTVEKTKGKFGKYMKQEALYEHYHGRPAEQTHRALDDVRQLLSIMRHLRTEGLV